MAPPVEANLINYLWPLLIVVSLPGVRAGAPAFPAPCRSGDPRPGRRRADRDGRAAGLPVAIPAGLRAGRRGGLHLGQLFAAERKDQVLPQRRHRAVLSLLGGPLPCHALSFRAPLHDPGEGSSAPGDPRRRSDGGGLLSLECRSQERGPACHRILRLSHAHALVSPADPGRQWQNHRGDRRGHGTDHWRLGGRLHRWRATRRGCARRRSPTR